MDLSLLGFQVLAWFITSIGYIAAPLMILGVLTYSWAWAREMQWVLTWEAKRKKREEAINPKPKKTKPKPKKTKPKPPLKTPPKPTQAVVSTFTDEYKLPQHPFS